MKTVLVTGGAGFIGAALARTLLADGARVITIDNFSTGDEAAVPAGVEVVVGDCQDPAVVARLAGEELDAIFHIAGQSSGEISFDDPVRDLECNTVSTLRLLEAALTLGCERFVYASSMSVYGDCSSAAATEETRPVPNSFYGVGKLASEGYLRIFSASHRLTTTALRLFSVYGPGQNLANLRQGIVSIFLAQALRDRRILVKGSADRFRDLVYIDDVVEAFRLAGQRSDGRYLACNVATGCATTVREMVATICDNLPFDVAVEYAGFTPGDVHGVHADVSLAGNGLGWAPATPFSDGVMRMIADCLNRTDADKRAPGT